MPIKFFNTLTRKKVAFKPLKKGQVSMYNCGPTLYSYAHIGNFRSYIFADTLRRFLEFRGFKVFQVMNLTDVDDKSIRDSRREGRTLKQFTDRYAKEFFEDIKTINILPARSYPRATENIKDIVDFIKALLKKGHAYTSDDGIYFKIKSFPSYGKLSHITLKGLKAGARVKQDEYDKESAGDFALWKFWDDKDGDVYWETELGKGRPGWHIECSVMSTKSLGKTFDIHTGGVDLVFPHHENEIAQSEACTGRPPARYWLHNEHLLVNNKKMSKSLGNFFTLRDLLKKGHDPMGIRYLLLSAHYRTKLNFTDKNLKSAENTVNKLRSFVQSVADYKSKSKPNSDLKKILDRARKGFETRLDDDLNMPEALPFMFDLITKIKPLLSEKTLSITDVREVYKTMMDFDSVLGLGLDSVVREHIFEEITIGDRDFKIAYTGVKPSSPLKTLVVQREAYRLQKNWKKADQIREKLKKRGIEIEDTESGVKLKKV
jgi:cysteinyl-tRNA synthetase